MKRIHYDDFPEPIGPLRMHKNGSPNLRSSHIDGQAVKRSSPSHSPYL